MMKQRTPIFLSILILLPVALFLGACGGFQEDPRDDTYEFRTPAKYRGLATVTPANTTVAGEGTEGVFVAGRTVILGAYGIAQYETTWELWEEVCDWARENGYSIANQGGEAAPEGETLPVTGVTWRDAVVWCNAYSELSGREPVYYAEDGETVLRVSENNGASDTAVGTDADRALARREKNGFRLPLETEWEYAARGGATDKADWNFAYSGSDSLDDVAWHGGNAAQEGSPGGAHPAGSRGANRLGLFDMSGNAAEWCWDRHGAPVTQDTPPDGPASGSERVVRGGSWNSAAAACEARARDSRGPFVSGTDIGFRVARTIPGSAAGNEGGYPPTLVGSSWSWDSPWGMRIITFDTEDHAVFDNYSDKPGGAVYDDYYTYDPATGTGRITGGYPAGDFQLKNDNTVMFFLNYKDYGHSAEFYVMDSPGDYLPTLVGTKWYWDSPWGKREIEFDTEDHAIVIDPAEPPFLYSDSYAYDSASGKGNISGPYPIGDFQLQNENKTMYIPQFRNFGHSVEFTFFKEESTSE
jgi:formylglycine-generating enzyme required for sulfatase activity